MREFAQRLMTREATSAPNVATAIFGTAGSEGQALVLGRPGLRIGLWPVVSAESPGVAMGLFALLGLLLERWQGVRVYRLAARVDGDPEDWRWTWPASQFGVDDWQLDDLDDNVGIWGRLETLPDGLRLVLQVEDDRQPEGDAPAVFGQSAKSLQDLVAALPALSQDIVRSLGIQDLRRHAPLFESVEADEARLKEALDRAFQLELGLYLQKWGHPWPETRLSEGLQHLAASASGSAEFISWLMAASLVRCLEMAGTASGIQDTVSRDEILPAAQETTAVIMAAGLFNQGLVSQACEWLEDLERPGPASLLALADLYRRSGRVPEAVEVLQEAVESDRADGELLIYYGDLLQAMGMAVLPLEDYVFLDPDDDSADPLLQEATYAWEAADGRVSPDPQLLQRILVAQAEMERIDEDFWSVFGRLVALDDSGDALRQVIEACYNLETLQPALDILRKAFDESPENLELGLNLAEVLLLEQEEEALLELLGQLEAMNADEQAQAELVRLRLILNEPDLEWRLGEIESVIDAGNAIRSEDTEWLEGILERSPELGGLHALLARAYLGWDEDAAALETLLDGHKRFPADAELAALLAEQLWQADETELAFEYLGKGLGENPNDVPLLALTGRLLFESGQDDAARACLARAEALAPRHPALQQARVHIAALMSE